jgi:glyoxylase-like metal-dependent hydrolase (beta-lactamase superfamily II)
MMGFSIEGVAALLARDDVAAKVHVQAPEAFGVKRVTGCSDSDLVVHASGDVLEVGNLRVTLVHTPGHTPGSQCFYVHGTPGSGLGLDGTPGSGGMLVSGDTLFLDGCGRTDLPGGDPEALYESLTQKLAQVPDDTVLYPGHLYSAEPSATLGEIRHRNYVFRPRTKDQWMMMFGHEGF